MRINNNLMAMNTHRGLGINAHNSAKSLEKLSSGLRINKAGDDAAGLAISEKMRAQVRGLSQASRNAQDAISLIQTAEGATSEIHSILQRMRELAVQSATDTNVAKDRESIGSEITQLKAEVDRIANNTEFNTRKILNYGATEASSGFANYSLATIQTLNAKVPGWLNDAMEAISARFGIAQPDNPVKRDMLVQYVDQPLATYAAAMGTVNGSSLTMIINLANVTDVSHNLLSDDVLDGLVAHEMMHGYEYTEMASLLGGGGLTNEETWFMEGLSMMVQGGNGFVTAGGSIGTPQAASVVGAFSNSTSDYASAYVAMKALHEMTTGGISAFIDRLELGDTLDQAMNATTQSDLGELTGLTVADYTTFADFITDFNANNFDAYLAASTDFTAGTGTVVTGNIAGSSSNLSTAATIPNNTGTTTVYTHFTLSMPAEGTSLIASDTPEIFLFQVGGNAGQNMSLTTRDLTSGGLGIKNVSLATQSDSNSAITIINTAIESVSSVRSYFGAVQNRLEHTIKNLDTSSENLQASESRIRDVDMAKEMMAFTKNNILQQAAQAMLAQANQTPQGVLQLLR